MKTPDISQIKQQYLELLEQVQTLVLSTVTEEGQPFASYSPYVKENGRFYIYISRIADIVCILFPFHRFFVTNIPTE